MTAQWIFRVREEMKAKKIQKREKKEQDRKGIDPQCEQEYKTRYIEHMVRTECLSCLFTFYKEKWRSMGIFENIKAEYFPGSEDYLCPFCHKNDALDRLISIPLSIPRRDYEKINYCPGRVTREFVGRDRDGRPKRREHKRAYWLPVRVMLWDFLVKVPSSSGVGRGVEGVKTS